VNADLNCRLKRTTENGGPDLPSLFEALLATFYFFNLVPMFITLFGIRIPSSALFLTQGFEHSMNEREREKRREERGGRGTDLLTPHDQKESIENNAAGTISGLARINEKAPLDCPLSVSSKSMVKIFPLSLCLTHSSPFLGRPPLRDVILH
jgi:hypothetical protein